MQFRAGIVYVALFLVVAAGAYGLIATAEAPDVTMDAADADEQLAENDSFEVNGTTYDVVELGGGSGTVQQVDESATMQAMWGDGDTVEIAEGEEYTVIINQPEDGEADGNEGEGNESEGEGNESDGDEAQPESFTLRETIDEEEYETVEREDGIYVVVEDGDTTELVHVDDVDEIDSQTYEVGDTLEFYESESEAQVEAEVAEITGDTVTLEYEGEEVEEFSLEHEGTVRFDDQEFVVFFPSDDEVYLSSDVSSFEAQQQAVTDFEDRVRGLWWVVVLSVFTAVVIAALAYMPVRG